MRTIVLHVITHRRCSGVVGYYHGDPAKGLIAANFHLPSGTTPRPGELFPARCTRCGAMLATAKEIEWSPADD